MEYLIATLGGLLTASWGAYKDSPYEGFNQLSFLRSIVFTVIYYVILRELDAVTTPTIITLSAIACERLTQEIWKAFFRKEQRSGVYKIPQSFHVIGKVLDFHSRLAFGFVISLFLLVVLLILSKLQIQGNNWIYVGLILAIIPSLGGAWKDAPIEGFEIAKFPRSFLIMFACVYLLRAFTNNFLLLIMSAAGLERLIVEFYKTFIISSVPGKFLGKVIAPEWLKKRKIFKITYAIALVLIITITQ